MRALSNGKLVLLLPPGRWRAPGLLTKESIRITRAHGQRAKSNGEDNYQATRNKLRGYPRVHPSD